MMEEHKVPEIFQPVKPVHSAPAVYPAGGRELIFAGLVGASALFLCNSLLYGGFRLGFAIGLVLCLLCGSGSALPEGLPESPEGPVQPEAVNKRGIKSIQH